MATSNINKGQIENRNYLSPTGFQFVLNRAPKVSFFCNVANIPGISMGNAEQPTYLKNIPLPGDKVDFEDLSLSFLVDENLENYMQIQNWIRGIGYPENINEIKDFQKPSEYIDQPDKSQLNLYSDGTLIVLSSNLRPNFKVKFTNLFPVSLSTLQFDATDTDVQYFTAEATFKYTIYNITDMKDNRL